GAGPGETARLRRSAGVLRAARRGGPGVGALGRAGPWVPGVSATAGLGRPGRPAAARLIGGLLPGAGRAWARGLEDDADRAAGRERGRLRQRPGRGRARWIGDDLPGGDTLADEEVPDALGAASGEVEPGLPGPTARRLGGHARRTVGGLEKVGHPGQLVAPGGEQRGLSLLEQLTARKGDDRALGEVADQRLTRHRVLTLGETGGHGVPGGPLLLQLGLGEHELLLRLVEELLSGDIDPLLRAVTLGGELVGAPQCLGGLDLEDGHGGPVVDELGIPGLEPLLGELQELLGGGEVGGAGVGGRSLLRLLVGGPRLVEAVGGHEVGAAGGECRAEEDERRASHFAPPGRSSGVSAPSVPFRKVSRRVWACSASVRAICSRASALASSAWARAMSSLRAAASGSTLLVSRAAVMVSRPS